MTTAAEIAAGRQAYEQEFPDMLHNWEGLAEENRAFWIDQAMAIVRAYERASWRPIAPDDPTDRTFLMSYPHKGGGWAEPYECKLWQLGEPRYKPEMLRIRDMPGGPEE